MSRQSSESFVTRMSPDEEPETLNLACGCCGVHKLALTHTNTVAIIDIRVGRPLDQVAADLPISSMVSPDPAKRMSP